MPVHSATATTLRLAGLAALLCGASACRAPEPPADDQPPKPQATGSHDAIGHPVDKAEPTAAAPQPG